MHKEKAVLKKPEHMRGLSLFKAEFHNFEYKKHAHKEYAIGIIEKGFQEFYHGGKKHIAPPGSIISVNPDEAHDGKSALSEGYRYRMVYIEPSIIKTIFQSSCSGELPFYFKNPITTDKELGQKVLNAISKLENNDTIEFQSFFTETMAELFSKHAGPFPANQPGYKDMTMVKKASEFIREKLAENITLENIANHVGMSQYHFLRIFKKTTGFSPHAYIISQRVNLAKEAIEKGFSIADAAFIAGFSDQSHFTRIFKSFHGITPGRYKKYLMG